MKRATDAMDLTPFKLDIDELLRDFTESNSKSFADMKKIWLSKKFSFIYEARPSTNVHIFMQSLYAHSISYMLSTDSLSQRLGGLYCLYCLYGTQPFKPPYRIYLSIGELKRLKNLVIDAKKADINVAAALVKKMIDTHVFLCGDVEINNSSAIERVNDFTNMQNARLQAAYKMILANTPMDRFVRMDLGAELEVEALKKMSEEYAAAKESAIAEADKVVDVQNIKHIAKRKKSVGDAVGKIVEDWNAQKKAFIEQTSSVPSPTEDGNELVWYSCKSQEEDGAERDDTDGNRDDNNNFVNEDDEEFQKELEDLLY